MKNTFHRAIKVAFNIFSQTKYHFKNETRQNFFRNLFLQFLEENYNIEGFEETFFGFILRTISLFIDHYDALFSFFPAILNVIIAYSVKGIYYTFNYISCFIVHPLFSTTAIDLYSFFFREFSEISIKSSIDLLIDNLRILLQKFAMFCNQIVLFPEEKMKNLNQNNESLLNQAIDSKYQVIHKDINGFFFPLSYSPLLQNHFNNLFTNLLSLLLKIYFFSN